MVKKVRGAQVGNLNGLVHGSYRNLDRVDGRTREARILGEVEAALSTALGGDPTPQETILIQRIGMKSLRCFLAEREILRASSDGQRRERLERDYLSWANSLRSDLQLLGMERRTKTVQDLQAYLEEKHGN